MLDKFINKDKNMLESNGTYYVTENQKSYVMLG